jgi:hypothetical protein
MEQQHCQGYGAAYSGCTPCRKKKKRCHMSHLSYVTPAGDLPGVTISEAELKLMKVYGDHIHQNDGTHLDGGMKDDDAWQA